MGCADSKQTVTEASVSLVLSKPHLLHLYNSAQPPTLVSVSTHGSLSSLSRAGSLGIIRAGLARLLNSLAWTEAQCVSPDHQSPGPGQQGLPGCLVIPVTERERGPRVWA